MGPEMIPIIGAGSFSFLCFSLLPSVPSCRGAPDFGELFQKNSGYKRKSRWEIRTRAWTAMASQCQMRSRWDASGPERS